MTGCGAALNTARVQAGNSVAVFGVGGVGLCVLQACANVGAAPIIAVDVDHAKLQLAARFGATDGIDATREDPVERIRALSEGGVDFAFDAIGVPQTMAQVLPAVRAGVSGLHDGGTAVLVGFPRPAAPTATLNMVDLFSARTYRGTIGGSSRPDADFPRYVQWFKDGKLPLDELVTRRFTLDQVNDACAELQAGRIAGRAILEFGCR
jgi:Zn-dependent alcohol dehydrogenase